VTDAASPGIDRASELDTPALYERNDRSGMGALIAALPQQARDAWRLGTEWPIPTGWRTPSRVVLAGVGGSAMGGDVIESLAAMHSRVPVHVVRNYRPPPVDDDALVVSCSFSGDTEEAITALEGSNDRAAASAMRLAVTTGGRLATIAREHAVPTVAYRWNGPPRTAFGHGLFPLLGILGRLGAVPVEHRAVERAIERLGEAGDRWGPNSEAASNEAKRFACRLAGRLPVIVGADFLEVAARRWASQTNENAKQWALHSALPEFDHNLVNGLDSPRGVVDQISVVLLDDPTIHERNRRRVAVTAEALSQAGMAHWTWSAAGESPLDAIVQACYLGDWVSYYLAMLNGVDPTPVPGIDMVKQRMRE
jgi:glucose/mannose-6-phosphate isomerase